MNYEQTTDYLFNALPAYQDQGKSAYKENLDNTNALMEVLKQPHQKFKSIHIAGTNGKGSVSHILASIFQACGYKTGLYTSPHLLDFRERVRINGEMISKEAVIDFVANNKKHFESIQPSFFEMTVAFAFDCFAKEEVDIAIIETGMGGRLDSTNILSPLASVITNISMDHAQFLGDTLEKIAGEKAGIIKDKTPVIIGDMQDELLPVFREVAAKHDSPLYFSNSYKVVTQRTNAQGQNITYNKTGKYFSILCDLGGKYQANNIATALTTIDAFKVQNAFELPEEKIINALKSIIPSTGLHGRWETLKQKPLWIADTGHNEAGISLLMEQIKQLPHRKKFVIYGCVDDKDVRDIFPLLSTECHYIFTQSSNRRSLDPNVLVEIAKEFKLKHQITYKVEQAVARAQELASKDDAVIVCGSTFVVADVLGIFDVGV